MREKRSIDGYRLIVISFDTLILQISSKYCINICVSSLASAANETQIKTLNVVIYLLIFYDIDIRIFTSSYVSYKIHNEV